MRIDGGIVSSDSRSSGWSRRIVASVMLAVALHVRAQDVVATVAGTGSPGSVIDGQGTAARFQFTNPSAIAVDASGNLFVADAGNHVIRKITPSGLVSTFAGAAGNTGSTDGTGT